MTSGCVPFRILDADVAADRAQWERLWQVWTDREVFGHPAYSELFREPGHRLLCAASFDDEGPVVLFPFIARPLAREPWAAGYERLWDGINPYGYGGPYLCRETAESLPGFWSGFEEWARNFGLVSLFARLSVFSAQLLPFDGEVLERAPNVVRSLDLSEEALWYDYEHKVRKNVKRATNSGLVVEEDPNGRELDAFLEIYSSTMDRRDASSGYYFPKEFFLGIVATLPGQFMFFHARDGERIVSTELVLVSQNNIYSFLGGTIEEAFAKRPNDLLKHEIIRWGMRCRKKAFILGGGYGGPDGIFRYKLAFAPHGQIPFRIARRIDLPNEYGSLVDARKRFEESQNEKWVPADGFFPAYRS